MANYQNLEVSEDTIFVTGLPDDTTEEQLGEFFGQIGVIKFDKRNQCQKIWIYKDKTTGKGKGEATITYDDPPTASSAITRFNGKEFRGSTLTVQPAQRKSAPQFSRGGARGGRGGFPRGEGRGGVSGGFDRGDRASRDGGGAGAGGRPSGPGRPGDWLCPSYSNNSFEEPPNRHARQAVKPTPPVTPSSYNNGSKLQPKAEQATVAAVAAAALAKSPPSSYYAGAKFLTPPTPSLLPMPPENWVRNRNRFRVPRLSSR